MLSFVLPHMPSLLPVFLMLSISYPFPYFFSPLLIAGGLGDFPPSFVLSAFSLFHTYQACEPSFHQIKNGMKKI